MIRSSAIGVSVLLVLIGGLSVVAMMGLSMADAILRQFERPILGANEMSEALMVVAVSCALPVSILSGKAISIDMLTKRLFPALRRLVIFLGVAAAIGILGFYAYRNYLAGFEAADFGEASLLLGISYGPFYFCIAAGAALAVLAVAYEAVFGAIDGKQDETAPVAVPVTEVVHDA